MIVGALFTYIGGYMAAGMTIGNTDYYFSPQSLIYVQYGIVVAHGISLLSDVYQAWRAANTKPTEVLHENQIR